MAAANSIKCTVQRGEAAILTLSFCFMITSVNTVLYNQMSHVQFYPLIPHFTPHSPAMS